MAELTEKQWAIIYAALLETNAEVIKDCLAGTEFHEVTDEEIDEVYFHAQEMAGVDLPQ
jgi:hypothetical protein